MNIKKVKADGSFVRDAFGRYRYELRIDKGKTEIRRRIWAIDDTDAARQAALIAKKTDAIKIRWSEGLALWEEAHCKSCSAGYFYDIELNVRRFI